MIKLIVTAADFGSKPIEILGIFQYNVSELARYGNYKKLTSVILTDVNHEQTKKLSKLKCWQDQHRISILGENIM